jgi:hypothetical protein
MKAILKNKKYARPCPSCGNSTVFDVQSIRSGVDCCDIYVECMECGYDPTKCHPGYRYEDVWGDIDYGPHIWQLLVGTMQLMNLVMKMTLDTS